MIEQSEATSDLERNTITVRGKSYVVTEIDGATMIEVRKLLADETQKHRLEALVTLRCCASPKFANFDAVAKMSHLVLKAISDEAFRLGEAPKGETPKKD